MRECYKEKALQSKRERKALRRKGRLETMRTGQVVQLPFGSEELLQLVRDDLQQLMVGAGKAIAEQLLRDEVERLCGNRYERQDGRQYVRYGQQRGAIVLSGQKVRIAKPRVRSKTGGEAELQHYKALQAGAAMPAAVQKRMVRGVSCRDYDEVIDATLDGFGISSSSVSRSFVRGSKDSLRKLRERRFAGERFVVVFIDGIEFAGETVVAALGVTRAGKKRLLGLRHGATENGEVCTTLLAELVELGLDASQPTLFVIDGSKALRKAVKAVWGRRAVVQRCQQHKKRNVLEHVPERHRAAVEERLVAAYGAASHSEASKLMATTKGWLARIAPDAAASLNEGLEETLTVLRLGLPVLLAKSLVTTNPIESTFSTVEKVTHRVKRWRDGDMRLRWCAAGLLHAESKFHRINGYADMHVLERALERFCEEEVDLQKEAA
jgi:putative transposase